MDFLRSQYNSLVYNVSYIASQIQTYFWHLLFGGIVFYYVYNKIIKPTIVSALLSYEKYRKHKEDREYSAEYHKNPDLFAARISAQQERAEKLQEKYNQQLKEQEAKAKEKAELKRQEILRELNKSGHRLGGNNDDQKPKGLRPEYNPLMGPGSSSNYRPPKRSKCGGGGCGK